MRHTDTYEAFDEGHSLAGCHWQYSQLTVGIKKVNTRNLR